MKFIKSQATLEKIEELISTKQKGAYLRFGDGDICLANGENDLLQRSNNELGLEMAEALAIKDDNVLKSLPLTCKGYGWEPGMFPGNHECDKEWADDIIEKVKPFWGDLEDVYSAVALHYLATEEPSKSIDFLKFLKNNNTFCLIGNKEVSRSLITQLFGPECIHIKTPTNNSFDKIDKIESKFSKKADKADSSYKVVIIAMGCSGRVLAKRIYKKYDNIFLFDFGSLLDALSCWNSRAWIELTKFDAQDFLAKLTK